MDNGTIRAAGARVRMYPSYATADLIARLDPSHPTEAILPLTAAQRAAMAAEIEARKTDRPPARLSHFTVSA